MKKIAFAGTFDPLTNGHLWVIKEGLNLAQEVVVMIAHNPVKKTKFSNIERKIMIDKTLQTEGIADRVSTVIIDNEYVAQSALDYGCEYLIRGIRGAMEFDYEALIQKTNTDVLFGAKTLFVMPPRDLESVSSSYVKSLVGPVGWHWQIQKFLPKAVYMAWVEQYLMDYMKQYLSSEIFSTAIKKEIVELIINKYSQVNRKYHSLDHILHCLQELERLSNKEDFDKVELEQLVLAVLFHDIVYQSENKTVSDEEQSAKLFSSFAEQLGLDNNYINIVVKMIHATGYLSGGKTAETRLEKILCSIDLSVLAQPYTTYEWYKDNVRKEYMQYSDKEYKEGRIKALNTLLAMDKLYLYDSFSQYELRARNNMKKELELLA